MGTYDSILAWYDGLSWKADATAHSCTNVSHLAKQRARVSPGLHDEFTFCLALAPQILRLQYASIVCTMCMTRARVTQARHRHMYTPR